MPFHHLLFFLRNLSLALHLFIALFALIASRFILLFCLFSNLLFVLVMRSPLGLDYELLELEQALIVCPLHRFHIPDSLP